MQFNLRAAATQFEWSKLRGASPANAFAHSFHIRIRHRFVVFFFSRCRKWIYSASGKIRKNSISNQIKSFTGCIHTNTRAQTHEHTRSFIFRVITYTLQFRLIIRCIHGIVYDFRVGLITQQAKKSKNIMHIQLNWWLFILFRLSFYCGYESNKDID